MAVLARFELAILSAAINHYSIEPNKTKILSCILPTTMLLRVFETPLLNILLGLRPLFTLSVFWRRYLQHSHVDTDYNATDLELSYWFSINHIGSDPLSISLILNYPKRLSANYKAVSM